MSRDDKCRPRNCLTEAYSMLSRFLQTFHHILHLCARLRLPPSGATVAPRLAFSREHEATAPWSLRPRASSAHRRGQSKVLGRRDHAAAATTASGPRTGGLGGLALVSRRGGEVRPESSSSEALQVPCPPPSANQGDSVPPSATERSRLLAVASLAALPNLKFVGLTT